MPVRTAVAVWEGNLKKGRGTMKFGSGAFEGNYSFRTRFEEEKGTNPEELIGAAHAGCFSMALAAELNKAGFKPGKIQTTALVHLEKVGDGFGIPRIELKTEAAVPGMEAAAFKELAEKAKSGCPVSKALAGSQIILEARLV